MGKVIKFSTILLFLVVVTCWLNSVTSEDNFTLSLSEKIAFDKFKQRVLPFLSKDYMKQDVYLIKFLRARNFDLKSSSEMLFENLRWRKINKMDTILEEDWADMVEKFYIDPLTVDKQGRPVVQIDLGSWDIRAMALSGQMRRFHRYLLRLLEELQQKVISQQRRGLNVTQWKVLVNLEEFSVVTHACPLCLPTYAQLVINFEEHYPGIADRIVFVNMPGAFRIVLDVITPLMTPSTRKAMKTFGFDKKEWVAYLKKEIDEDQLGKRFGGTKKSRDL